MPRCTPHLDHGLKANRQLRQFAGLLLLELLRAPQSLDGAVALAAQLLHAGLQLREPHLPKYNTRSRSVWSSEQDAQHRRAAGVRLDDVPDRRD